MTGVLAGEVSDENSARKTEDLATTTTQQQRLAINLDISSSMASDASVLMVATPLAHKTRLKCTLTC